MISKHVAELVVALSQGKQLESQYPVGTGRWFPFFGSLSDLEDSHRAFRVASEPENMIKYRLAVLWIPGTGFIVEAVNSAAAAARAIQSEAFVEWFGDWMCEHIADSVAEKYVSKT